MTTENLQEFPVILENTGSKNVFRYFRIYVNMYLVIDIVPSFRLSACLSVCM